MEKVLVGIFDKKAKCYISINGVPNTAIACREFMTACKDEKSMFAQYPKDFNLQAIGTFNDKNGELKQKIEILLEADNCVIKKENTEKK